MINRTIIQGIINDEPKFKERNGEELNILCFQLRWENEILDKNGNPKSEFYVYDIEVLGSCKEDLRGKYKKGDNVVVAGALLLSSNFARPVLLANSICEYNK